MTVVLRNNIQITKRRKLKKIEDEEWREISGSNGLYFVSNYGRIKSLQYDKNEGEIITGGITKGYWRVQLTIKGKSKRFYTHKLVAEIFITKPTEDCTYVIHLDWNKRNNHVNNLAWLTSREMHKRMFDDYRERNKKRAKKIIRNSKLKEKDIVLMKTLINRGVAQNKIAEMFCISATQVKRITRGENWGHIQPELKKTEENATSC